MRLMRNRAASTAEIRGQISRATDLFELLLLGQPVGDGELERLSTDAAEPGGDVMARLVLRQLTPQLPPGGAVATYQRVLQLRDIKRSVRALSRDRTAAARLHAR